MAVAEAAIGGAMPLVRRRDLIAGIGLCAASPLTSLAQSGQVRRVGILSPFSEQDPETQARLAAFKQRLEELGWVEGRNLRLDYRFTNGMAEPTRAAAKELVSLAPDVILAYANPAVSALMPETGTIPIVFAAVSDPIGSGFVGNLAHPGGRITGFHSFEPSIASKWLELLKEAAPQLNRVAVVYDPGIAANVSFLRAAEAAAHSLKVVVTASGVRQVADLEGAIADFARGGDGGLVVAPAPATFIGREVIIGLVNRYRLPAIYSFRFFIDSGGLMSLGYQGVEQFLGAASYVDRILRGEDPGALPLQLPTKYQLVINLKAAKTIGLTIPEAFLSRADEVIE
jgi:putative tryptophan/tyrosine transport system substrate-binding protein